MARSFRSSRFRRKGMVGEDVNPSAYIVNLADCMLVLACGFMVAMISFWNIDISVTEMDSADLQEVDPEIMSETLQEGGSYYVEAGKVYMDPATGIYYMVEEADVAEGANTVEETNTVGETADDSEELA